MGNETKGNQKALANREEGIKGKENERLPTKLWCRHSALLYLSFGRLAKGRKRKKGGRRIRKGGCNWGEWKRDRYP